MNKPETFCDYYNENICRSCNWLETPYAEQIQKKETRLKEALSFLPKFNLLETMTSDLNGFRNKAKMTVTGSVSKPIVGILGDIKTSAGLELLSCPIHHPKLNEVISAIPSWIEEANLIPYDIQARTGELKGVILFYSEISREIYLRFVLRSQECVFRIKKLMPKMIAQFPELVCISANLQPKPHAILEGDEEIILSPKKFIRHQIGNLDLNLSPKAFVQTHSKLAAMLYQTAADWIEKIAPDSMLELYCGQGAFSFFAAPFVKSGMGIEINRDAVVTANETAARMGLSHLKFICADATQNKTSAESVQKLVEANLADLILVNPPRRGIGPSGVELILTKKPANLIYSSCSVDSLAIDLKNLALHYQLEACQIFDIFPHTDHFETLAHLKRQ